MQCAEFFGRAQWMFVFPLGSMITQELWFKSTKTGHRSKMEGRPAYQLQEINSCIRPNVSDPRLVNQTSCLLHSKLAMDNVLLIRDIPQVSLQEFEKFLPLQGFFLTEILTTSPNRLRGRAPSDENGLQRWIQLSSKSQNVLLSWLQTK